MKPKDQKQSEAATRQEERRTRTAQHQLARLDAKIGVGVGAVKERKRLMTIINAQEAK